MGLNRWGGLERKKKKARVRVKRRVEVRNRVGIEKNGEGLALLMVLLGAIFDDGTASGSNQPKPTSLHTVKAHVVSFLFFLLRTVFSFILDLTASFYDPLWLSFYLFWDTQHFYPVSTLESM